MSALLFIYLDAYLNRGETMKRDTLLKYVLIGAVSSVGALADMVVDKTNGVLTVTSSISGTVIAKVIGPNNEVVVNEKYEGNSFTWTPSGEDGAYRYDVNVLTVSEDSEQSEENTQSDYAGGSVEVKDGDMEQPEPAIEASEK